MMAPSVRSPTTIDRPVAAARTSVMGLVNCATRRRSRPWCRGATRLRPSRARRPAASAGSRPVVAEPRRRSSPSSAAVHVAAGAAGGSGCPTVPPCGGPAHRDGRSHGPAAR